MLKKLLITTAASGLMLSGAWAQATPPSSDRPATPPAASERSETPPAASDKQDSAAPAKQDSGSAAAVTQQKPDQLLASKFKGTDVIGSDNQKIGDVSDILFDKQGKIEAYVISVGGFLGMGAKDIALPPSQIQWTKDGNEEKLKVSMTKDQLQQAAKFEPYNPPRQTTGAGSPGGAGGGAGSRPAGGGMAK